jgi:leader peptidase (prepilin peptidase)/N-methyltransferase
VSLIEALSGWPLLLIAVTAVLGLIVGSFLNVVILRLPRMLERQWWEEARTALQLPHRPAGERFSLAYPPSRCRNCGAGIPPWHNIPVLSWLWLRGRCANCSAPVSIQYPLVELLSGLAAAACAWRFGWSPQLAAALVLSWALIALAVIDLHTQLLPDAITLPLLWLGLALSLFGTFVDLQSAVVGAMAGYLVLWSVYWLFKLLTGKEGMGFGDFKLLAALGAWLGWQSLPLVILLSSAVGAAVGIGLILSRRLDRGVPMPFGPYLACAGWIALVWGDQLISRYLSILQR